MPAAVWWTAVTLWRKMLLVGARHLAAQICRAALAAAASRIYSTDLVGRALPFSDLMARLPSSHLVSSVGPSENRSLLGLALMIKYLEICAERCELGLELGKIAENLLLLLPLGQKSILTGFQLGQLLPQLTDDAS